MEITTTASIETAIVTASHVVITKTVIIAAA